MERSVAQKIITHYQVEDKADLEKIIRIQKIHLDTLKAGMSDDIRTWYDSDKNIIFINNNICLENRRFALAHSLGHYFLNHTQCPEDTYEQMCKKQTMEIQANIFAYELLMPKNRVEYYLDKGLSQLDMSEKFGVLFKTMGNRLISLGEEYDREYTFY